MIRSGNELPIGVLDGSLGKRQYESMALTEVRAGVANTAPTPPPPTGVRRNGLWVIALVVVVCLGLVGVHVSQGGTRLRMGSAGVGAAPERVGVAVSFGIPLTTTNGPSVVLQSASATHSPNVAVSYSIVRTPPGEVGIGTEVGSISRLHPSAVRGVIVAQPALDTAGQTCTIPGPTTPSRCSPPVVAPPNRGQTWLVVTVTPTLAGPWTVTKLAMTYRSWWRARTASGDWKLSGLASAS